MLLGFLIILGFLVLGSGVQALFDLPLPSSILGMLLLFVALILIPGLKRQLEEAGNLLQRYLGLFFFPLGTALVLDSSPLAADWLVVILTITVSTALAIAALGATVALFRKLKSKKVVA